MKKNVLFAVLTVAATLCACTREPLDNNTDPTPEGEGWMTITAGLEGCSDPTAALAPETRTYLHTDGETPLWKDGDQFIIIGKKQAAGNERVYELTSGNGSTTATFGPVAGAGFTGTFPYYAVYPSSLGISRTPNSQIINFSLPPKQTASETASGQMPAFAFIPDAAALSDGINFKNVCGLFQLALTSTYDVVVGKLEIIDLAGNILWGNAHFNMGSATAAPASWVWSIDNTDADKSHLIVECSATSKLHSSKPTYFYAAVPPGALSGGVRVIIYDDSDNPIDEFCSGKNLSVGRAHIKPMKSTAVGTYTLLDLEGTANCYMADRSQTSAKFKFCATKGNGGGVTSIASAATLWQTNNTDGDVNAVIDNVGFSAGCVTFTVTGEMGNAVIAARNSSSDILWSWHIWAPSTEVTSETYSTGSKPTVMDRNLGALVAYDNDAEASVNALSNGLIYQWGRKDPFPGLATYGSSKETVATCTFTVEASTEDTGTTGYATSHPTVFLSKNPSADWMASTNADLWGGANQDTKTEWDPCPPGYKVPNLVLEDFDVESGANAVKLDGKHWYPTTGEYYANDGDLHDISRGYYWTTNNANSSGSRYYTSTNSTFTKGGGGIARGMGMAVRCVAE